MSLQCTDPLLRGSMKAPGLADKARAEMLVRNFSWQWGKGNFCHMGFSGCWPKFFASPSLWLFSVLGKSFWIWSFYSCICFYCSIFLGSWVRVSQSVSQGSHTSCSIPLCQCRANQKNWLSFHGLGNPLVGQSQRRAIPSASTWTGLQMGKEPVVPIPVCDRWTCVGGVQVMAGTFRDLGWWPVYGVSWPCHCLYLTKWSPDGFDAHSLMLLCWLTSAEE